MGLGSLIGSLSLAFIGSRRPLVGMIIGGGISFVTFETLLGLSRSPLVAFPLIVIVGLSSMLMINTINVIVQRSVPDALRGRVMALYVTVFAGSTPIGGLFAGSVAQAWGPPAGFLVGAGISVVFIGLVAWQLVVRRKGQIVVPA
jgi:predicted MFS family arabinose efflux permease